VTQAFSKNVVLITGAAKRIGRSIALHMAEQGWHIIAHYHTSASEAHSLVDEITNKGGNACSLSADLEKKEGIEELFDQALSAYGKINCLINNASVFDYDSIQTMTRSSWDHHLESNLWAPLRLTQLFAEALPEGQSGNVINILDQRVWNLTPHYLSYTVSKTALWTLTQTLALALAPQIRVNGIGPGPTLKNARQTDTDFQRQIASLPLKIQPSLEEICKAISFILNAPSLTGQMIALDGGQHMGWAFPKHLEDRDD
jgi:NAD(P)-dependent dehydrogenase (short-subunit alcohol dehydrogenase family)